MDEISSNIKERVLQIPKRMGISIEKFLSEIGMTYGSFKGKAKEGSLNSDAIEKILTIYPDIDPIWLITGKGDMKVFDAFEEPQSVYKMKTDTIVNSIQQIPLYNIGAAAGIVHLFKNQNEDKPIDFIRIPGIPKCDGAIHITGDSMYPLLKSGDIAMYKQIEDLNTAIFFWGEMYIVGFENDGDFHVMVKYVQKSELGSDYITLVSYNQHHKPFDLLKNKIKALALVKASVRINSMG